MGNGYAELNTGYSWNSKNNFYPSKKIKQL